MDRSRRQETIGSQSRYRVVEVRFARSLAPVLEVTPSLVPTAFTRSGRGARRQGFTGRLPECRG